MSDYVWPADIPAPVSMSFAPAKRLRTSDGPGMIVLAPQQRDFRGTEQVELVFTAHQAEKFESWRLVTLRDGAMLWRATWPTPAGWTVSHVRKFTSSINWQRMAGTVFRVNFSTELLGRYTEELRGAYDEPSVFDGAWQFDGSRYLYKFYRPT